MALPKINDFTITEWVDFEAYDRVSGMLDFKLEEMQDFTINATQDKTPMTGKNGRVIGYKKSNKAMSGEGTYALLSAGLMKAQTGGDISYSTHIVKKSEYKKVNGATLITDATAVGTEGGEIGYLRVVEQGSNAVAATYEQAAVADATHFAYNPETKTITLPVDNETQVIADNSNVLYAYEREVAGTKVTDPTDKFSEVREVWIHCFGKDSCDKEYYAAIYIPRADFSGEFSIELGGDQAVHNFSFDAATDLCDPSKSANLFELIVYTDEKIGTQGMYSVTVSTALASGDSVTIAGVDYAYDGSAATAEAQAQAIYALLSATTAVTTKYTLARSGAMIVFTENYGQYGVGAPIIDRTSLTTGAITSATIKQGEAAD